MRTFNYPMYSVKTQGIIFGSESSILILELMVSKSMNLMRKGMWFLHSLPMSNRFSKEPISVFSKASALVKEGFGHREEDSENER